MRAIAVAARPAFTLSHRALRTAGSSKATANQCVVQCLIGSDWTFDLSKAKEHDDEQWAEQEHHDERGKDRQTGPRESGQSHMASKAPAARAKKR